MKKHTYIQPAMQVIETASATLLAGSVNSISGGDTGIEFGGSGSGDARSRELDWELDE